MLLLGLYGKGREKWDSIYAATCSGNKNKKMYLPQHFGKHNHMMPKFFKKFDTIMAYVKHSVRILDDFESVTIPKEEEALDGQHSIELDISQPSTSSSTSDSSQKQNNSDLQPPKKKSKRARSIRSGSTIRNRKLLSRKFESFTSLLDLECKKVKSKVTMKQVSVSLNEMNRYKEKQLDLTSIPDLNKEGHYLVNCRTFTILISGDAELVHKYATDKWRKHLTHIWMRNISVEGDEELLSICEGKDSYMVLFRRLMDYCI